MNETEMTETLASIMHDSWSHWMSYLFQICEKHSDGSIRIPPALVERWHRQINTPYAQLSEQEKLSDRNEVVHLLPIMRKKE